MQVHIIGGGIIGLCSAWYLNKAGYEVTLIDQSDLQDGTSHGNAGMIVPSHFIPLAAPGVIGQGLKWMLDSKSPFYIKPRLSLELAQWLWRFYRSCTPKKVERAMPVLKAYNEMSKTLYQDFANHPDFDFCFEKKGLLMLYRDAKVGAEEIEMAEKAHELGMKAEILDAEAVQKLESGIQLSVAGGVFYPGDAHLYPNRFNQQLITQLKKKGVIVLGGKTLQDFRLENGRVSEILLSSGETLKTQQLLISAGSWTAKLLKKAGVSILLQDGKGYSTTLHEPAIRPGIPSILTEAKVAITPMGDDLRIGGTLEISNLSEKVNTSRLSGIMESLPKYYPEMEVEMPQLEAVWHGFRPCSPDGLPYMGYSKKVNNLFVATGHAMMGMSMGPASGKLVAQMMSQQATEIDVSLFSVDRF